MPTYEYLCQNCNKDFSVVMSISQYEQGKVKCPECGKEEVKQQVTPFVAQTSRKS
ncbi:MAG: zinc ribbon domain-containing protein [Deltaproteobacteria bacterium]|nr:zinc ribbon domain-containing protein [Deltaproteobacteria bacterium]MBW2070364.1 zinc ribbon domain-containing protein [Deltaproteobacteria bacterium]